MAVIRSRSLTCARIEAALGGMGAGCKSGGTMSDSFARFTMTGKVQSASLVSTATPAGAAVPSTDSNVESVQASPVHGETMLLLSIPVPYSSHSKTTP